MEPSPKLKSHGEPDVENKEEDVVGQSQFSMQAATSQPVVRSRPKSSLDEDDNEGDVEDDGVGSIMSARSAFQPVHENGRRYCNDTYFMPNDEIEQTRLSITHQAYLILFDGALTKVPLSTEGPNRVLDIGTGPGDWAVEMGLLYPYAEIIATDISVFDGGPATLGLPNVHFHLDDAEDEWTYHEPFDFVHFRDLSGAFRDWRAVYEQAFKHLKPGGYIEVVESDPAGDGLSSIDPDPDSYHNIYIAAVRNAADFLGYSRSRDHLKPSMLVSIGFVDVRVHDFNVPLGTWPTDPRQSTLGKMVLISYLEGLEAKSLRPLTAAGRWTVESIRDLCEKVKQEAITSEGSTISVKVVTGRKPE